MPEKHAILSPSAADRWLRCPGSVPWCAELPPTESEAAAEGTVAHRLAEGRLKADMEIIRDAQSRPEYSAGMDAHIDTYVDYVHELAAPDGLTYVEQTLRIVEPDVWGTSDCIVCAGDTLHVVDLKYGKGVRVFAENNPQCLLYAWGALNEVGWLFDFKKVCMHIVQPRLDHISVWELTVDELKEWMRPGGSVMFGVEAASSAAKAGRGLMASGSHCRFCAARNICRERLAQLLHDALRIADNPIEDNQPREITPLAAANLLNIIPDLRAALTAVEDGAFAELMRGGKVPGRKLVLGRSQRKITDAAKAEELLRKAGFETAQIMELRCLTDLEKAVGKKELAETLKSVIVKSEGKPAMTNENDPRAEWTPVEAEFKEEE